MAFGVALNLKWFFVKYNIIILYYLYSIIRNIHVYSISVSVVNDQ